jgi:putative membrane protein
MGQWDLSWRKKIRMMYWDGDGLQWWGYLLMSLSMIVFWGLVIGGIVALVRYLGRAPEPVQTPPVQPTPEQILGERFARGELDEEEYARRLDALRDNRRPVARS